ncbi:ECF transporter S component [Candidatus Darwinibacter acetoxidans]|jgi:uncharacterized membrane protein|nr:ECF transporter S component [Limnochordia bacterium]MDI9465188.1 ECF transporter S component [Bacillota bacterium]NLO95454.1 ECF transporter S component [Bacillota bacterium]HAN95599.1 ECF transporter S component [Bacillota bacterium]HOB39891.1 ECF transporter S component [Limnochordia bacterium]
MQARKMVLTALLVGVVAVVTMVVNIPLPGVKGYVNIGDTVVLLSGVLFGPLTGLAAGGLGSALADLLLGYGFWAPWTLLIKGLEGLAAGWLIGRWEKAAWAVGPAAALMVLGYFLAGSIIYGWGPALASLPGDLLQGAVSAALCLLLHGPLKKYLAS